MSRQGKHKECKTLFGAYVTPEIKALAQITSEKTGYTFTEIILEGLRRIATAEGILVDGKVSPEYASRYDLMVKMTYETIQQRKEV